MIRLPLLILFAGTIGCQSAEQAPSDADVSKKDTMTTNTTTPVNNQLSATEQADGWQLLFDGTNKNNWHVYNKTSDGAAWKVTDGTLHLDTTEKKDGKTLGGGDLVSDVEYEDFDLKLEWKLGPGGNSGVLFYVHEDPKFERTYHTGPEMQVLDNAGHADAKINKHRAGDLYDLISGVPETVKPAGEWNQVEIVANKGVLAFHLNGTQILTTTLWDDNWKKMIADSKFKEWSSFGTFQKGRIALQDHGDPVWYRNIKIRKL